MMNFDHNNNGLRRVFAEEYANIYPTKAQFL